MMRLTPGARGRTVRGKEIDKTARQREARARAWSKAMAPDPPDSGASP